MTSQRLLGIAALGSVLPDIDSLGFVFGIPYGSLFGHRGFTHSLAFALLLGCGALPLSKWLQVGRWWAFFVVFLSTASHGLLDALTDGGLGVAFFSPFSNERFFLPWSPFPASPIGLLEVFSSAELHVLASELMYIWLPCLLVAATAEVARRSGRGGTATSAWRTVRIVTILAIAAVLALGWSGIVSAGGHIRPRYPVHPAEPPAADRAMLAGAIENLERQAARLAAQPGAACPQDFSALETGRPLRISLFYGYDEHAGKVHDRAHAHSMAHVLTSPCHGQLSTCGFALVSRSSAAVRLSRAIAGRSVEVSLYTSSPAEDTADDTRLLSGSREPEESGPAVKDHFLRELVESDIVFYMGHSRLGGSIGFDQQTGVTTVVNAVFRRPMLPVLEALRQRPTRLKILGMFSCSSNQYFRQEFQRANPALSLILTTGEVTYGPAEQASLGALEAVLSQNCGYAFHRAMISATEPDRTMTYLFRGR
ncbi:MAG: inner membrane protein [Acidobacteriota bacterium]|nr:inner membrane protein [Acidobacteriota bacterium]